MNTLYYLLTKEFKQIFRDPAIVRLILVMPAIQLLILPFAADYEMKNVNVIIVDQDHSSLSQQLTNKFQFSAYFKLVNHTQSYQEALKWIENEKTDIIIQVPKNFERNLIREGQVELLIAANAINGTKGNLGTLYATQIIKQLNQEIRMKLIQFPRLAPHVQIKTTHKHWFNIDMNYQVFMVPGILAVLLAMVGIFLAAMNIVKEKEIGTIEQINVTPIRKHHFILGKLIPFWLMGYVILTIGMIISYFIYGIYPAGSMVLIYFFSGLFMLAVLGIGLFISTVTHTQQQAMLISFFFMLIFILLGGIYTPIDSMPHWAQVITWFNPLVYLVEVMRMIILKGSSMSDLLIHFFIILSFAIVFNAAAVWNYRKTA